MMDRFDDDGVCIAPVQSVAGYRPANLHKSEEHSSTIVGHKTARLIADDCLFHIWPEKVLQRYEKEYCKNEVSGIILESNTYVGVPRGHDYG